MTTAERAAIDRAVEVARQRGAYAAEVLPKLAISDRERELMLHRWARSPAQMRRDLLRYDRYRAIGEEEPPVVTIREELAFLDAYYSVQDEAHIVSIRIPASEMPVRDVLRRLGRTEREIYLRGLREVGEELDLDELSL